MEIKYCSRHATPSKQTTNLNIQMTQQYIIIHNYMKRILARTIFAKYLDTMTEGKYQCLLFSQAPKN